MLYTNGIQGKMENAFIFNDLPLPPTSNLAYRSFVSRGRVRHVCSPDLVRFKRDFRAYWALNLAAFKAAQDLIAGLEKPVMLGIHCDFYFEREKLFTKDNRLKKLDVSNRLKAIHDCLAEALGVDDSCFVTISASKLVGTPRSTVEIIFPPAQ